MFHIKNVFGMKNVDCLIRIKPTNSCLTASIITYEVMSYDQMIEKTNLLLLLVNNLLIFRLKANLPMFSSMLSHDCPTCLNAQVNKIFS